MKRICFIVLLFLSTYLFADNYTLKLQEKYLLFFTDNVKIPYDCILSEIVPVNNSYCKVVYSIVDINQKDYPHITEYIKLNDKIDIALRDYNETDQSAHTLYYTLTVKSFTYNKIETEIIKIVDKPKK